MNLIFPPESAPLGNDYATVQRKHDPWRSRTVASCAWRRRQKVSDALATLRACAKIQMHASVYRQNVSPGR